MWYWRKYLELSVSFLKIHNPIRTSGEREGGFEEPASLMSLALAGRFITTSATCEAPKGRKGSPNLQQADALHPYLESSPLGCLIGTTNSMWPTWNQPPKQVPIPIYLMMMFHSSICMWHCHSACFPSQNFGGKFKLLIYSHILHSITFSTCPVQTITSSHLKYSHNFCHLLASSSFLQ